MGRQKAIRFKTLISHRGQKTVCDLCPHISRSWSSLPGPDLRQWKELSSLMKKCADRDDVLQILKGMDTLPNNVEQLLKFLRDKITIHSELFSTNRSLWRKRFYEFLPFRQAKRYVEKFLGTKNHFKQLLQSVTAESANKTAKWGFKEFWQASLQSKCTCGATNRTDLDENAKKRLKFTCPEVKTEDQECLGGRSAETVRAFIMNASLFRVLKLVTKWKTYREPQFSFLHTFGKQMFLLFSESCPSIGRRIQNVWPLLCFPFT